MPSLSPRRWNALAWLSILAAACGGSTSTTTGYVTDVEVVAMAGTGGASGESLETACAEMAALPCPRDVE